MLKEQNHFNLGLLLDRRTMLSVKGRYENGKLILYANPEDLPPTGQVVLTFVPTEESASSAPSIKEEYDEEYYAKMRQHARKRARGKITIIDDFEQVAYQLNDYSQGGLSFLAPGDFNKSGIVNAGIMDPSDPDTVLMELEMEIRGIYDHGNQKKVGCQFQDSLDEEIWHGLVAYLG